MKLLSLVKMFGRELWLLLIVLFGFALFIDCAFCADSRKKIVVLDTGVVPAYLQGFLCKDALYDVTGKGTKDVLGHGTNIAGLISKQINPDTHCIVSVKWFHSYEDDEQKRILNPFHYVNDAIKDYVRLLSQLDFDYLNMSIESSPSYSAEEEQFIKTLVTRGVKVVLAAGNRGADLDKACNLYPICYKVNSPNFYVVTSDVHASWANVNGPVNAHAPAINQCYKNICLSGTSQAAANFTAELLRREQTNVK